MLIFILQEVQEKNILILTEKSGRFNAMLHDNTAPAKWRIAPLLNSFC